MTDKQIKPPKFMHAVLFLLIASGGCIILILGGLLIMSPGKIQPVTDLEGKKIRTGISEKVFTEINGTKQGMFIKGTDKNNPVLLYLHGGMPDYFLDKNYKARLEDYFTVVWWEQRGSGISFVPNMPAETKTQDGMISDVHAMTDFLRQRFNQDKIYLMGHSGGSFIGILAAASAPGKYFAYIGVAQISNQRQSEVLAHDYMLTEYRKTGNRKMAAKLEAVPVTDETGTPREYLMLRDIAMHDLGIGTCHDMKSVVTGIFLPSLLSRDYTLAEKINMWRGKAASGVAMLWNTMLTTDLSEKLQNIELPVYFLHGIYDYTCSYTLARSYFQKINAPVKGFYTFYNSAHSPFFEEPGRMHEIIREDILKGQNTLADRE